VPESKNGVRDEDGCPEEESGDKDGDGYPDATDQCPNAAEDFDNFEDNDGCPDPDNDEDGILDNVDDCKEEPEDMDGDKDTDGCPDDAKIVFTGKRIVALEKIQFATGSTRILPTSMPIVEAVADVLKKNPKLEVLEVGGHADERGDDTMNLNLTNGRAKSVLQALVQRGIAADRLRSIGYGEYCPIDDRSVAEAWEKNRRVEFKVLITSGAPTGVEQGCPKALEKGIVPPKP
jgi:outer membrane protein OmpA-like peptidoglycan-associated protein